MKRKPHYRWWNGMWYEPQTEHISRVRYSDSYKPLRGKAVFRQLFGNENYKRVE